MDLEGDTWHADVGSEGETTNALLAGLISSQLEVAGWNAIPRNQITASSVERVNDVRIEIKLSGFASYG